MSQIDNLLAVSTAFGAARGIGEARVSTLVFKDGKRLRTVREGADIGTRTIDRAMQWFSDNWSSDAEWPSNVSRPAKSVETVAA